MNDLRKIGKFDSNSCWQLDGIWNRTIFHDSQCKLVNSSSLINSLVLIFLSQIFKPSKQHSNNIRAYTVDYRSVQKSRICAVQAHSYMYVVNLKIVLELETSLYRTICIGLIRKLAAFTVVCCYFGNNENFLPKIMMQNLLQNFFNSTSHFFGISSASSR